MQEKRFQFQQFSLAHHKSTMPIGTDAVLLGAWAAVHADTQSVLDIGCGCGIIGLMVMQRAKNGKVTFLDMDQCSMQEAESNGNNSPWKEHLSYYCTTIQEFAKETPQQFDLIVSNPPYFENSLKSPVATRTQSRHTDMLSFEELIISANSLLTKEGNFCVVLPRLAMENFVAIVKKNGLFVNNKTFIFPTVQKEANRVLLRFSKEENECIETSLILRNEKREYTDEYKKLTYSYHINTKRKNIDE